VEPLGTESYDFDMESDLLGLDTAVTDFVPHSDDFVGQLVGIHRDYNSVRIDYND
jgi:hypothetical protein